MYKLKILGILYTFTTIILLIGLPLYYGGMFIWNKALEAEARQITIIENTPTEELPKETLEFQQHQILFKGYKSLVRKAINFYIDFFGACALLFSIIEGITVRRIDTKVIYYEDILEPMYKSYYLTSILCFFYCLFILPNLWFLLLFGTLLMGFIMIIYIFFASIIGDLILNGIFKLHSINPKKEKN